MKDFDYPLIPVNKTAGKIISSGYEWKFSPKNKETLLEWDFKPVTKPIPLNIRNFKNLIGLKSDCITIVGFYGFRKRRDGKKGVNWLGRCTCGKYVLRNSQRFMKSIKNKTINRCSECLHIDFYRNKR